MPAVNLTPFAYLTTDKASYAERLAKLSGMAYAQRKYTAEEWLAKTGQDPRNFKEISFDRNGLAYWSLAAETLHTQRIVALRRVQHQLGIA